MTRTLFSSESIFLNTYIAQQGGGEVCFTPSVPGDIEYYEPRGEELIVRDASYLTHHGDLDVCIAMGGGTDIAKEAGDIVLVRNDLRGVAMALEIGEAIRRKIIFNLFWAFIYNVVLIPIATGALYPLTGLILRLEFAGLAMALSSISVTSNALTLRRRGRPKAYNTSYKILVPVGKLYLEMNFI